MFPPVTAAVFFTVRAETETETNPDQKVKKEKRKNSLQNQVEADQRVNDGKLSFCLWDILKQISALQEICHTKNTNAVSAVKTKLYKPKLVSFQCNKFVKLFLCSAKHLKVNLSIEFSIFNTIVDYKVH